MNLNKYIIGIMLATCFLFTGCGEDKTIYENASTTSTTVTSGSTTTTIGGTTTTTSGSSSADGASLFSSKCAGCHGAKNAGGSAAPVAKPTSVSTIKSNKFGDMSMGLTDAQLSAVATYINGL